MKEIARIEQWAEPVIVPFVKRESRIFRVVGRKWFRFKEDWIWRIHFVGGGAREFIIPAGYETNGASVPMIVRSLISALEIMLSGFGHDRIYTTHEFSRAEADAVFRAAIIHLDERPAWVAWGAWAMVRLFARSNYKKG